MISRRTTTILIGASTAIAGLYVLIRVARNEIAFVRRNADDASLNGKKRKKTKKNSRNKATGCDSPSHDDVPMFDYTDPKMCETVITMAQNRAKRWISYQVTGATRLIGQVGGKSVSKRPVLTLDPDFILKPVHMDERGIREVAFYEAIQASTKRSLFKTYCSLFGPRDAHRSKRSTSIMLKLSDWVGLPLPWKSSKDRQSYDCCDPESVIKEAKLLHRLDLFTAEYYGLVEHKSKTGSYHPADVDADDQHQTCPYGTKYCSHILAGNLTINFSRPSVMDIKMGMQTYEPDAPEVKRMRERKKYELQEVLGFRIVALRIFDPSSVENAKDGYVYFPKSFGRSLISRDEVKRAFVKFFGGDGNGMLSKEVRKNRSKAIKKILSELKLIRKWFYENDVFSFTASSLLVLYESNDKAPQPGGANVKMIDFGRVRRRKGGDPGYRQGLRTLCAILEEILRDEFSCEEYDYVP